MSFICDGRIVTQLVDEIGCNITLRVVTETLKSGDNEYGEFDETWVDSSVKAIVWIINQEDVEYKEGNFQAGDIIFIFDNTNESKAVRGNRILYEGKWYEIDSVKPSRVADTTYHIECFTKVI